MLFTSHRQLVALLAARARVVRVTGLYDAGQTDPIAHEQSDAHDDAVLADGGRPLSAKHSTRHKVLATESQAATGSYTFSANAERNAENPVHFTDPTVVTDYTAYLTANNAADDASRTANDRTVGGAQHQAKGHPQPRAHPSGRMRDSSSSPDASGCRRYPRCNRSWTTACSPRTAALVSWRAATSSRASINSPGRF